MPRPIGVLYEHPEWFRPLFAELERRRLPYLPIAAHEHTFDPARRDVPYGLVFNRVSPSSYLRGHAGAIFYAHHYLAYLEQLGVPVVNGSRAYALETSKARQLALLAALELPHPRSRVVNHLSQVGPAAAELSYPIIIKPNIGGSGALMRRLDTPDELQAAVADGSLGGVFGLDGTAIVQEYHPPRGGSIVRVEALAGEPLYAIRIQTPSGFNLCPADICQVPDTQPAQAPSFEVCPAAQAPARTPLHIEVADPPAWVVDSVLRVFEAASIEVGGVEYLESERDGQLYLYDINALSNFVTDAPRLVGFDPFERLVDYLEQRWRERRPAGVAVAA